MVIKKHFSASLGMDGEKQEEGIMKKHKDSFGYDRYIHYFDYAVVSLCCGYVKIYQMVHFK